MAAYFPRIALAVFAVAAGAQAAPSAPSTKRAAAVFAGGCFWCMQEPFDHVNGVTKTVVGYTEGDKADANYNAVSAHKTQHREAIDSRAEREADHVRVRQHRAQCRQQPEAPRHPRNGEHLAERQRGESVREG